MLSSGCTVAIQDATYCAVIPGDQGAICDSFLSSQQQILNQAQWDILQGQWENAGDSVECTTSSAVANLKQELEELCSKTACDYPNAQPSGAPAFMLNEQAHHSSEYRQAIHDVLQVVEKIDATSERARARRAINGEF